VITEPEMADGQGGDMPTDLLSDSDSDRPAGAARRFRPWLWAAGGVVAASAVWAAVLHGTGHAAPALHGYHLRGNPCNDGALAPLKSAVGERGFASSEATVSTGPAVDELSCLLNAVSPTGDGWVTDYTVTVSVELHKKTDPGPEFENARRARVTTVPGDFQGGVRGGNLAIAVAGTDVPSASTVHPVAGVGDQAYLLVPRASDQTLVVLHGGAVLRLQVTGYRHWNGPGLVPADAGDASEVPDLTGLRPAMTAAMRHLMVSLAS
jgi:hypothetical protein